jgi:isopentenyl-diphosphate delta-isomerase
MIQNNVILVDENDVEAGTMEKMEAHRKAALHRAISVCTFNSKGEWLLQQRAIEKYHSKGLWTNTSCSHPFPGESSLNAANRRLFEEMGMSCELSEVFTFIYKQELEDGLTEHELDHVFIGLSDSVPTLNPEEVMDYKYIITSDLVKDIEQNPDNYTVWFKLIYKRLISNLAL